MNRYHLLKVLAVAVAALLSLNCQPAGSPTRTSQEDLLRRLEKYDAARRPSKKEYRVLLRELRIQSQKWETLGSQNYDFVYRKQCYCLQEDRLPMRVTVRGGRLVKLTYLDDSIPDSRRWVLLFSQQLTVTRLFEMIQSSVERQVTAIELDYDETLGFPRRVLIDGDAMTADDYTIYHFTDLKLAEDQDVSAGMY